MQNVYLQFSTDGIRNWRSVWTIVWKRPDRTVYVAADQQTTNSSVIMYCISVILGTNAVFVITKQLIQWSLCVVISIAGNVSTTGWTIMAPSSALYAKLQCKKRMYVLFIWWCCIWLLRLLELLCEALGEAFPILGHLSQLHEFFLLNTHWSSW